MSGVGGVQEYFTRAAVTFVSLYPREKTSRFKRFLNQTFRPDIYERFLLPVRHVKRYQPNSVLDVGCGSGRYAIALTQAGVTRYQGIDLSPAMIQLAKDAAATLTVEGKPEFIRGDFMDLHTDEKFDIILAMGLFDYIKEPAVVLSKMKALANHSVVASFSSRSWYRTPIRKARYVVKRCPVYFYDRKTIERLSMQAGFARTAIHKIEGAGQDYFVQLFRDYKPA